jgi:MobC-like protein
MKMERQKNNRNKWLHIRVSESEYKLIHDRFSRTNCRKISDYCRRILMAGKVTTFYRNQSLDAFMEEMMQLRKELNALGNNFNQTVKKLHTLEHISEFKTWVILNESGKQILQKKVAEIKAKINQISDKWLQ